METSERTLIDLPKIFDIRGNLTVAESLHHVPFDIKRVYWTYDIPAGESRGGHAHKECREKETFHLNHPWQGLLVETGIWRTLEDFSSGSVCLVLASEEFLEADYIREYDDFVRYIQNKEEEKK